MRAEVTVLVAGRLSVRTATPGVVQSPTLVSTEESQSEGALSLLRTLLPSPVTHTPSPASGLHRSLCLDRFSQVAAFLLFLDLSSNISSFERPSLCPVLLFSKHVSKSYSRNYFLALSPQLEYKRHETTALGCLAPSYVLSTQESTWLSLRPLRKSVTNQIHLN